MLTDSVLLGDVAKEPYDLFVYRACREADGLPLFALSLYPDGTVWAEPVDEAAEEDLVGVFAPTADNRSAIREALRHEAVARGFRAPSGRRVKQARSQTFVAA